MRGRAPVLRALALVAVAAATVQCDRPAPRQAPAGRPSPERLPPLVVQPEDLAGEGKAMTFTRFDEGPLTAAEIAPGAGSGEPVHGWKARYRRAEGEAVEGIFVVDSRVELFPDAGVAVAAFEARTRQPRPGRPVDLGRVGDRAEAVAHDQPSLAGAVRYYEIAWVRGPLTAVLVVSGYGGDLLRDPAVRLARTVDERMRSEVGGARPS